MTSAQLRDLLEELEDTQEIVIRRMGATEGLLMAAWREARDDAQEAFAEWAEAGGRDAFATYRAAEDRADAALAALSVF